MTNFSRNLTLKFKNVRYGINLEKEIITCIIDVEFNHESLGLIHCLSPKEFRRLVSVCGGSNVLWRGFTVTGKAKCFKGDDELPEDEFDEKKGSKLAFYRAKRKALRRCRAILNQYTKDLSKIAQSLNEAAETLSDLIEATDDKVEEILE